MDLMIQAMFGVTGGSPHLWVSLNVGHPQHVVGDDNYDALLVKSCNFLKSATLHLFVYALPIAIYFLAKSLIKL